MIYNDRNKIYVTGSFTTDDMPRLVAAMHNLVSDQGYQDLTLDYSQCESAFPGPMLAIVARCQYYWAKSIDISLILPTNHELRKLFVNANWAHLIDIQGHPESQFRGYRHVPTIKFSDGNQQQYAVSKIMDTILSALSGFDRGDFQAFEWSINEITDNVINHSSSPVGGFIQATNFSGAIKRMELAIIPLQQVRRLIDYPLSQVRERSDALHLPRVHRRVSDR